MIERLGLPSWGEYPVTLLVASSGVAALTWLLASSAKVARWQRGIWQAGVLAMLAIVIGEFVGAGELLSAMVRTSLARPSFAPVSTLADTVALDPSLAAGDVASRSREQADESTNSGEPLVRAAESVASLASEAALPFDQTRLPDVYHEATEARRTSPSIVEPLSTPSELQTDHAVVGPLRWCLLAWVVGSGLLSIHAIARYSRLLRLVRHARPVSAEFQNHVQLLARRFGMRRGIAVRKLPGLLSPVAFGIIRPTVGLPPDFGRQHNQVEQDVMLTHELAHLAGGDPAWQALSDLMVAFWWWQPVAWWMQRRLESVNEIVADEASLVLEHGPETLAECLVVLGRRLVRSRQLGWSGIEGGGFRSALGKRVERLLSLQDQAWRVPRTGWMTSFGFSLAMFLAVLALTGAAWARAANWRETGEPKMTIQQAWRRSLGSLTLMAAFGSGSAAADEERKPEVPPPPGAERREVRPPAPPAVREERRGPDGPDRPGPGDDGRRRDGGDEGRLDRLKKEARRLREEGKTEDATRVEKEFREALTKMLKYTMPQLPEDVRNKLAPKIEQYFKARDEGKFEDADRIEEEAKEIMKPFDDKIIEPKKKIHHLRGAADNLRAAGMNDLADKLTEQIRQLEQEFGIPPMPPGGDRREEGRREERGPNGRPPYARNSEGRGPDGRGPDTRGPDRRPEGDRGPDGAPQRGDNRPDNGGRGPNNPQQDLLRILQELRNDVENLRREVKELRQRGGEPERRKPVE